MSNLKTYSIHFTAFDNTEPHAPAIDYVAFYQNAPEILDLDDIEELEHIMVQNLQLPNTISLKIKRWNVVPAIASEII